MGIAEAAGAVSNSECMLVSVFIQTGGRPRDIAEGKVQHLAYPPRLGSGGMGH